MDRRPNCQARQYSDQMQCPRCGLAWDVNDDDPPACQTDGELGIKRLRDTLERRPHHDRG